MDFRDVLDAVGKVTTDASRFKLLHFEVQLD